MKQHEIWGWCLSRYAGIGYNFKYLTRVISERKKSQVKRVVKNTFRRKSLFRGHRGRYGS